MPAAPPWLCGRIRVPVQGPPLSRRIAPPRRSQRRFARLASSRRFAHRAAQAVAEAAKRLPQALILDGRQQAADLGLRFGRRRDCRRPSRSGQAGNRSLMNPETPDGAIAEVAVETFEDLRLE